MHRQISGPENIHRITKKTFWTIIHLSKTKHEKDTQNWKERVKFQKLKHLIFFLLLCAVICSDCSRLNNNNTISSNMRVSHKLS